jgi:tripartite-type tricarboxylate transporter receptor subunit TctC
MRTFTLMLAATITTASFSSGWAAQSGYPEKTIRLIVGFPAGGQVDSVGRLLGQKLSESLGKPVVIENFTGAAGNIASERVAKTAPNGYTLGLFGSPQIVINPHLYKLPYDPLRDLAPITQVSTSATVLVVHPVLPAKSLHELIALANVRPGDLTYASSGTGSMPHLAAELLRTMAGVDIRHVPYKGISPALPDLLAGRISMAFSPYAIVLPLIREGKLRPLAVTSSKRSPALPDAPTVDESGFPGFEVTIWSGLLAPAALPGTILSRIHVESAKALGLSEVRAQFAMLGVEPAPTSPEAFAALIKSDYARWAALIKATGIRAD